MTMDFFNLTLHPIALKILYIEDDDINLMVIEKMLKHHEVETCKTASDGKVMIQSHQFDIILLDMILAPPKMKELNCSLS